MKTRILLAAALMLVLALTACTQAAPQAEPPASAAPEAEVTAIGLPATCSPGSACEDCLCEDCACEDCVCENCDGACGAGCTQACGAGAACTSGVCPRTIASSYYTAPTADSTDSCGVADLKALDAMDDMDEDADADADAACDPILSCGTAEVGLGTAFSSFKTKDLTGKSADEGVLDQGAEITAVLVWDAAMPQESREAVKVFNEYLAMGHDYVNPLALVLGSGENGDTAKVIAGESGLRTLVPTDEMLEAYRDSAGKVLMLTAWGDSLYDPVQVENAEKLRDELSLVYFANFVSGCCG